MSRSRSASSAKIFAVIVAASGVTFDVAAALPSGQLESIDANRSHTINAGREFSAYLRLAKLENSTDPRVMAYVAGLQREIALRGELPFSELVEPGEAKTTGCDSGQGFYLRRDKLDISIYNRSIDESAAEGAAISYTDDRQDDTQTAEVHALAAYVFARNPCASLYERTRPGHPYVSGYAFAARVSADGTLTADRTDEKSALKPALDAQIEIAGAPFIDLQYVTLTPYYQTDFRGEAQAYGFSASWQPYNLDWRLGGSYQQFSPLFDFFYQLQAEAVALRVNNPGLTDLVADTDYMWLGGTARLHVFLLPDILNDRLTWTTSYQYYGDTKSNQNVHLFTTNLGYNLTADGKTSVSLQYQRGEDRDTLQHLNQYLATLNVKY